MATVDKIIVDDGGVRKTLSAAEWKALPLAEKVTYLRSSPRFYAGTQQIDAKEAIAALRS